MQLLCGCDGLVMHMFYNDCAVNVQINGIANIQIYSMVTCSSGGLVMTENVQICDLLAFWWSWKAFCIVTFWLCVVCWICVDCFAVGCFAVWVLCHFSGLFCSLHLFGRFLVLLNVHYGAGKLFLMAVTNVLIFSEARMVLHVGCPCIWWCACEIVSMGI